MKKIILGLMILALAGTQVQTAKANGWPIAAGVAGGVAVGTAIGVAASQPYYAAPAPYPYYAPRAAYYPPAYYAPAPVVYGPRIGLPLPPLPFFWGGRDSSAAGVGAIPMVVFTAVIMVVIAADGFVWVTEEPRKAAPA